MARTMSIRRPAAAPACRPWNWSRAGFVNERRGVVKSDQRVSNSRYGRALAVAGDGANFTVMRQVADGANGQRGTVLVEKRWWNRQIADSGAGPRGPGRSAAIRGIHRPL